MPMLRLEQWHSGRDYRVVVFDAKVHMAYERCPLRVHGDGISCISSLFEEKKSTLRMVGRDITLIALDDRITHHLQRR